MKTIENNIDYMKSNMATRKDIADIAIWFGSKDVPSTLLKKYIKKGSYAYLVTHRVL